MLGGALGISLAPIIKQKMPGLAKMLKPVASAYTHIAGYRQMGLKYDDLIVEEREDVQKALGRLSARESYDRAFRHRVAFQQSILHKNLPKSQWVKKEDDKRYLKDLIRQVEQEDKERAEWDAITVERVRKH
ncbi:putative ubiquinol--cytochrome-c reductase [Papiliotrema laurentii]|uniref:Complex III subunit 7 n=1 Tax=Papiliotrema laurentii TaxID=5418 RepID=A0AAD9CY52_PAPLA|nr:putative ubiquinol--cytochrome-c reductase [Papiliotrema laurentii]